MALQQNELDAFLRKADKIAELSASGFHDNRDQGTRDLVQMACKEFPQHNVMVIYTKHSLSEMEACTHSEITMRGPLGWPVAMQVYVFKSGIILATVDTSTGHSTETGSDQARVSNSSHEALGVLSDCLIIELEIRYQSSIGWYLM